MWIVSKVLGLFELVMVRTPHNQYGCYHESHNKQTPLQRLTLKCSYFVRMFAQINVAPFSLCGITMPSLPINRSGFVGSEGSERAKGMPERFNSQPSHTGTITLAHKIGTVPNLFCNGKACLVYYQ